MSEIQYINYSGKFSSEILKTNKLSSPESFDDYDFNIINLSDANIWENTNSNIQTINDITDITTIASMIKKTKNRILVILPQNLNYKYSWGYTRGGRDYQCEVELRANIKLLNYIIELLIGKTFNNSWLMYNKTKTKIGGIILNSDFVFQNVTEEQSILYSTTRTSTTAINYLGLYFTTLNVKTEEDILNLIQGLGWNLSSESEYPKWIESVKFLNDDELYGKKNEISVQIDELNRKQIEIEEHLKNNNFYKSILFKSGQELVDVVNVMLKEMIGYKYEEFEDTKEEDFLCEVNDVVYIGEIKGIGTNVKRSNILQTAMHKSLYLEIEGNENKSVHSIAIINRQRNLPLEEREIVNHDVEKIAEINDVLLILTETFLKIYEGFKKGNLSTSDIITLFNKKGLLKFED